MADILILNNFRTVNGPSDRDFIPFNRLKQKEFLRHEQRSIGDIQSCLVTMGFSHDPIMNFTAFPNIEGVNNRVVLEVDVASPHYQRIFGEIFNISISKYSDDQSRDFFIMETPLSKSSGTFKEVIRFVENFINSNLGNNEKPIKALVASI